MRYAKNLAAVPALALLVAVTFSGGATAQGQPNLTITSFGGPACAEIGETIGGQITITETNNGTAALTGATGCPQAESTCSTIGFYISADATITTGDTLLTGGRENLFSELGAGVPFNVNDTISDFLFSGASVTAGSPTGNVFLGAIVDEQSSVTEANEGDNTASQAIQIVAAGSGGCAQPDLVVDSLTHDPASPDTEDNITFTAVVKNIGGATAGASTLSFKIGGESPSDPNALFAVGSLAPGASQTFVRNLTLIAQSYLNTAVADFGGDVAESNEGNNTTTDSYTVTEAQETGGLIYQVVSLPANGALLGLSGCSLATPCNLPDVALAYEPDPGFVGTDSFDYRILDTRTGLTSIAAIIDILVFQAPGTGVNLTVDFQGSGTGDVALDVGGTVVAICDADCTESFGPGDIVKLQARPLNLSTFGSWGGACSIAGSSQIATITLPASGSSICTATFNP